MSIFLQELHCYAIYSCVITRKCTFCLFVCLFVFLPASARSNRHVFITPLVYSLNLSGPQIVEFRLANENLPLAKVSFKATKSQAQANHLEMFLLAREIFSDESTI